MAKIFVKEVGWMEVEESKEEIKKALENNPRWHTYTIDDSLIGALTGNKNDKQETITIRTSEITAIK